MLDSGSTDAFPAFRLFANESGLIDSAKGSLAARIPRILGQGKSKAVGFDVPPALIERKLELAALKHSDVSLPQEAQREVEQAELDIQTLRAELMREDGVRKLAVAVLRLVGSPSGTKDNRYYAGRFVLTHDRSGFEWSWSVTPHYPVIRKLPPDAEFIASAFFAARDQIQNYTMPPEVFEERLRLAWLIARHFSSSDDVLVTDVMRMFNVAAQPERFWQAPKKQNFTDLPTAAFVLSLMQSKRTGGSAMAGLEFVPATLNQAHGKSAKVFFLPLNPEGTEVRPMVYLRPRSRERDIDSVT